MRPELEWARDAAVTALRENPVVVPWAFEFTPAASDAATETYLQKVRDADFVIWLVGSETTGPVRDEIAEALASNRRLWVIRLPADTRDELTTALLADVGQRAKYADVANADELRIVLELTFADEVVRALSETPGLTRLAQLEALARASRARMVRRWTAVGLPEAEAIALADDPSVGAPPPSFVPTAANPLSIVVGDVGSGKSVLGERALQQAIVAARERAGASIPVFVHAYETVAVGLEAAVAAAAEGLGDVRVQGAFVVVDGLDEIPRAAAIRVLDAARVLVAAYPQMGVLITSRPTTILDGPELMPIPELTGEEVRTLIIRASGRAPAGGLRVVWPHALDKAIRRPLFAILFGLDRRDPAGRTSTTAELIANLVAKAIDSERAVEALPWLQRLAVLSTDRDGAPVQVADVGDLAGRQAVTGSRLVIERERTVQFALPIFSQWFAAESLNSGTPTIVDLLADPLRLERWRYPLAIAVATGPTDRVDQLMEPLARNTPGFASQIVEEAVNRWAREESSEPVEVREAGRALRGSILAWAEGLGPLCDILLPHREDGGVLSTAIGTTPGWLTYGWHSGDTDDEVVEFPPGVRDDDEAWQWIRQGRWAAEPGWAWRWGRDYWTNGIEGLVGGRRLRIDHPVLIDESLWLLALTLVGRSGSFSRKPVAIDLVRDFLRPLDPAGAIRLRDSFAWVEPLLARVETLAASGETEIRPPWPGPDLPMQGGWIWNPYSDERQRERTEAVYVAALEAYEVLVNRWFPRLRTRMLTASTLPARLVGQFYPSTRNESQHPVIQWHLEALPFGSLSTVSIQIGEEEERLRGAGWRDEMRAVQEQLVGLRPDARGWIGTIFHNSIADTFGIAPLGEIVYEWLKDDLRRTNMDK